jgi:uncharacterized protein with NRDE domain
MCLLIAYSRVVPGVPLLLAGNRDELLSRPAEPMALLEESPRILGGRDLVAGGTWMAVGEHGLIAALTNRPPSSPGRRAGGGPPTPALRSRGELPLCLVRHAGARDAVKAFVRDIDSRLYNPCWILVGDRESLFYLEVWGAGEVVARELPPGLHILENRPLDAPSPKVDYVRAALAQSPRLGHRSLARITSVLASREIPPAARGSRNPEDWRPLEVEAACVHAGAYGTRWSGIVAIGRSKEPPRFCFADGAPCEVPFQRARWPAVSGSGTDRSTSDTRT